jgi:hypothetical protein
MYLKNGETLMCPTNCPSIRDLIRHIRTKGYLVDHIINPSSLMSDNNGIFKIVLGDNMLIVIPDTPANRKARPWVAHWGHPYTPSQISWFSADGSRPPADCRPSVAKKIR